VKTADLRQIPTDVKALSVRFTTIAFLILEYQLLQIKINSSCQRMITVNDDSRSSLQRLAIHCFHQKI
jgi:hypothetical protein